MEPTTDILRGELERLFELEDLKRLSGDLLGYDPEELGGLSAKATFVRALVDRCAREDALEALADAVMLLSPDRAVRETIRRVFAFDPGLELGTSLGGYKITKKVGEGALGAVYLGELGTAPNGKPGRVAIKVIGSIYGRDRSAVRRYLTVLRAVRSHRIDGLAPIVDVGTLADGRPWVATQFVEGQSLAERVAKLGPMQFSDARPIFRSVLQALGVLHNAGLVHGDVRIENVFVVGGSEHLGMLVDPGTDRLVSRGGVGAKVHGVLPVFGTAKAVDPELARGNGVSAQSDLYGVGTALFEVLTGRPPFTGDTAIDVLAQHLVSEPAEPSTYAPKGWMSRDLDRVVLRALAKNPAERFSSAEEFLQALESASRVSLRPSLAVDQAGFEKVASALRQKPDDIELAAAVERVVEPSEAWEKAIELFTQVEAKISDATARKMLLFRKARLQESALDHAGAEATYLQILQIDPDDSVARVGIEELKRASGNAEELVDLLLHKVEREETPAERATTLREIAQLYEHKLGSSENALVAWVQAFTEDPKDRRSVREIERLTDSPEKWNETMHTLTEAAHALAQPSDGLPLYVVMGRWYAERLKRPDFALQCFQQALSVDPVNDDAYDGIIQVYERGQSWTELVQVLEQRAGATRNRAAGRDFLARAAETVLTKLGEVERAAKMLHEVIAEDSGHPIATRVLAGIYQTQKKSKELAELLVGKAQAEHGATKIATLLEAAEIFEAELKDSGRAEKNFAAALVHDAHNVTALKGLERIYAKSNRTKDLLENLEVQLAVAATPRQKVALLERIGAMQEEEFVDRDKAIEAFERVVAIEPSNERANASLERHYRDSQRFADLADTLERHARSVTVEPQKIELLLQAARVCQADLGALDRAIALTEQVLAANAQQPDALGLIVQLQAKAGDADAALDAVRKLAEAERDPVKKSELWVRAGKLLEEKGARDRAVEYYKHALDAHAHNTTAVEALSSIYSWRGDVHGALGLLTRQVESTTGKAAKAKLLAEIGTLQRERLKETSQAKHSFAAALELDATCTLATLGLAEIAFEAGDFAGAAVRYEPLLARTGEMDPAIARDVSLRAGDALSHIGKFAEAQRAYMNAKAFAADDREVLERLADVTFESGAPDEAAEMYRDIQHRFRDLAGREKGRISYRLGESLRRAGEHDAAVPALVEAVELIVDDAGPSAALASAYEALHKWDLVEQTLRRRLDHAPDGERFDLLVRLGDLFLQKKSDRDRAAKMYVTALEIRADDRNLLGKLMAVYSEAKDWSKLVEVIVRIAGLVSDPKQLAKYYTTAASITFHELGRLEEAADYYERALDREPTQTAVFHELIDCRGRMGDAAAIAHSYRRQLHRLAEVGTPEERVLLWDALAAVLSEKLNDATGAAEALEEAQKLDPEDRGRAEKLAALYASDPRANFQKATRMHYSLLQTSPYRADSYRALGQLYAQFENKDAEWCVSQALHAMSQAEPGEEAFFKKHRSADPARAEEFFTEELWARYIVHGSQDPLLTRIFQLITPAVVRARSQPIESFGVQPSDRRDPERDPAAIAKMLHYAAGVSQIPQPDVYYRESDAGGLSILFSNPPAIGIGKGALAGGPAQALAFVAGRHLAYFRGGLFLRRLVPTGSGLKGWLLAAIKMANPAFPVPAQMQASVTEHMGALSSQLEAPQREQLTSLVHKLLEAAPELDMKKWVSAVDLTADRAGFVLSNNLDIAAAVVRASPEDSAAVNQKDRLQELFLYSVSAEYLHLRKALGIALK